MIDLSSKHFWYALGLAAIFIGGFLVISLLNYFFIDPFLQRQHWRKRTHEDREDVQNQASSKIFKTYQDDSDSLVVNILKQVWKPTKVEHFQKALRRQLLRADIYWNMGNFLAVIGIMGALGLILGLLWEGYLAGSLLAVGMGLLPLLIVKLRKTRKSKHIEKQIPNAMGLIARSLKAGHTLAVAVEIAGRETPAPLGTELLVVYEEQRLGISLLEALTHLVDRAESQDLRYLVTAIVIINKSGGNIAEILDKIGFIIRDRLIARARVSSLTAEGRISALLLTFLPIALFAYLYLFRKDYLMPLFSDPLGIKMLVTGIILLILGLISMKKMIGAH